MISDIDLSKHQKPLDYPLVAIVGATASGKSDFALDLACAYTRRGITAEIVCADAFQLYRGMDIGTAKVTQKYQRGFAHHQLDVLDNPKPLRWQPIKKQPEQTLRESLAVVTCPY